MVDRRAKLLRDMLDAGAAIQQFPRDRTVAALRNDLMLRSAVERQFEIIGEALRRLQLQDAAFAARITQAGEIVAFRNLIAHGYDSIDQAVVWGIAEDDLPPFLAEAASLLAELRHSSAGG